MRHRPLTRLALALAGVGLFAVPSDASAQAPPPPGGMTNVPGAEAYTIRYWITNEEGQQVRALAATDFNQFVNKARCECGHELVAEVRLKATSMGYNQGTLVATMVGTSCAMAEVTQVGQFRPCAKFKDSPVSDYVKGLTASFHPIWLSQGVDRSSTDRNPATAPASGRCDTNQGEGGIWMAAQTNNMGGYQADEFFIQGTQNINIGMGGVKYDFLAPQASILTFQAQAGDSAIVLNWTLQSAGDINGFRVLCEDADTGLPVPGKAQARPGLTAPPNGTFFYTKDLICPNGPFSSVVFGDANDTAGDATTDGTTDGTSTTGDTTGGLFLEFASTGSTEGSTSEGSTSEGSTSEGSTSEGSTSEGSTGGVCGDGITDADEDCDDGNDVDTDACLSTCKFNVSEGMRNMNWDYVCTGHIAYNTNSVRIDGLENGKNYNFMLVAYDLPGNPKAVNQIVQGAPVETYDLWEQCAVDGGVCGESGFCNVGNETGGLMAVSAITMLGLGGIGVARRRRNRA